MDLTTVAAFTAAALSLVNVGISAHLARRGQLDQWRRDTERPIVATILSLSTAGMPLWETAAGEKARWIASLDSRPGDEESRRRMQVAWDEGTKVFDQMVYEFAQLELVAGKALRTATHAFIDKHAWLRHVIRPSGGAEGPDMAFLEYQVKIGEARTALIENARADLGIGRGRARSLPLRRQG